MHILPEETSCLHPEELLCYGLNRKYMVKLVSSGEGCHHVLGIYLQFDYLNVSIPGSDWTWLVGWICACVCVVKTSSHVDPTHC